jgi:FGGY-family pentulose kinase
LSGTVVGVDVGSTSARAGVFDQGGRMLGSAQRSFATNRPAQDHAEHSSDEIWGAVGHAVREAVAAAQVPTDSVLGIAFDATCSLVLLDRAGRPVSASVSGEDRWNVVMWADHRAVAEAREISATGHRVLEFVGGVMSPEMELPKLLWLKRQLPQSWGRYGLAMDLADFLTWKASGIIAASACTVTCKWTYLNHEDPGWQTDFLEAIGLGDVLGRLNLPGRALQLGTRVGLLTGQAATDLGLRPGTAVGVGLIDAHAGGLGLLANTPDGDHNRALALIAGTSSCHMALSPEPRAIPGIWGPYYGAMMPSLWLNEGGQSATGALLDHLLDWHVEGRGLGPDRHAKITAHIAEGLRQEGALYARDLLVLPDFYGNRSPLADPNLKGLVYGLDLDSSVEGLARLYYAAAVGIAYGTRHIVDELNRHGYAITRLYLTGGHAKSELLVRLYADASGLDVVLPRELDAVLLGSAINAASAAGLHPNLRSAGVAMVKEGSRLLPDPLAQDVHEKGYRKYRYLIQARDELLSL